MNYDLSTQGPRRYFSPPRPLNDWEQRMLGIFTAFPFVVGGDSLRRQIPRTHVDNECGCGCLSPSLTTDRDLALQVKDGKQRHVYELYGDDADGMMIFALLFVDDGYLSLLEVMRGDSTPFTHQPDPRRFLDVSKDPTAADARRELGLPEEGELPYEDSPLPVRYE